MRTDVRLMVYLLGFVAIALIRIPFMVQSARSRVVAARPSLRETALSVFDWVTMFLMPALYFAVPQLRLFPFEAAFLGWPGAFLLAVAIWLFWRSHRDLGRNWSTTLEIREAHKVVRHGVYARIRHPMYAACLLWGLAQLLLVQDFLFGPSCLLGAAVLFLARVEREERMMLEIFGNDYASYMNETGRLIPKVPLRSGK